MAETISTLLFGQGLENPFWAVMVDGTVYEVYISQIVAGFVFCILVYSAFRIIGLLGKRVL